MSLSSQLHPFIELLRQDQRYKLEGYQFVREALEYAQQVLHLPNREPSKSQVGEERHLTGQELCEAIRLYALEQFGYLAKLVFNSWGIYSTGDFGEIVYNLIRIEQMKKSKSDRREDFDDVFDFDGGFQPAFPSSKERE